MTLQDYEDITILKHAAEDILRYVKQLVVDAQPYELESEELIEKGKLLARIGEIISEILENGKHLPSGEEEK
jgi:hypothetical protein